MEHFKGILGIVLLTLLSIVPANHVEASSKKYLVLFQSNSDQWTAYDNLTEVTSSGSIMLIAKPFAEIMKFEYSENTEKKQFTLKRSQIQYNTYSLNSKNYSYTNRGKSKSMKANYKAYISKSDKNNLCYADSVSTLCYYKMFKGSDIEDFKQLGYDGVLCYSLSDKISKGPYILNVRYPKGTGLKKRLSSDVHYLEVNKSGQINITLSDSKVDDMPLIYKVGDENIITCSWGILSDDIVPLNIEAKSVGITYINVYLSDYSEHITILIYAVEVTEVSDSGSEIDKQNPETSEQQGYIYLTTYYDTYTLEVSLRGELLMESIFSGLVVQ